jgi:hypothetical protein
MSRPVTTIATKKNRSAPSMGAVWVSREKNPQAAAAAPFVRETRSVSTQT